MPVVVRIAVASTLSSGLYAAAVLFGPVATPLLLVVPLPGLVLATRIPAINCVLWFVLSAVIVEVGLGAHAVPAFALVLGLPALMLVLGLSRTWSVERTVAAGVAAWTAGIGCVALLAYGHVAAVIAAARQQLAHGVEVALSTYGSIGVSESVLAAMEAEREVLINGLLEILPALVVLTGALTILVNLVLARRWIDDGAQVNLRLWRTPDALIWVLIATGFGMFAPLAALAPLARNLFLVVLGCYFCQGLAIVSYYLDRFRLPRGLRVASYLLIAVQHIVAAMVLALGVFDLWGNFRRLSTGPADIPFHTDGE